MLELESRIEVPYGSVYFRESIAAAFELVSIATVDRQCTMKSDERDGAIWSR